MRSAGRLDVPARREAWRRLTRDRFDVLVVGGGITGCGVALDAASRGLATALVEARDLASGTSSRSSKLIHGGLRYLEQLDFALVREALRGELILTRLAPHLVRPVPFLYPLTHRGWERPYVGAGMTMYDNLGGARSLPRHRHLSRGAALRLCPALRGDALVGAICYHDAQTDDARYTLSVARTAAHYGATIRTSTEVVRLIRDAGRVVGAEVRDVENGDSAVIRGRRGRGVRRCVDRSGGSPRRHGGGSTCARPGSSSGRSPRPDRLRGRADPAHRGLGTVRHPVGKPLDRRHDRFRLESGSRPSGRQHRRHRLPPRTGQSRARQAALHRRDIEGVYAGLRPLLAGESEETSRLSREHAVSRRFRVS